MKHGVPRTAGAALLACAAALLGCASSPPVGSEAIVGVWKVFTPAEAAALPPRERQAIAAAGLGEQDVAAGRLLGVHCAMMTDGWWTSLAVLPKGLQVAKSRVLRLQVGDQGSNEVQAVNQVIDALAPSLTDSLRAYDIIPDWRERGLRNNFRRVELAPELRDRYLVVQGSYLVKCRP